MNVSTNAAVIAAASAQYSNGLGSDGLPPNFAKVYLADVDQKMEDLTLAMVSGKANSFDEYKYMVGQYRGYATARNNFIDLIQSWENRT